MPNINQDIEIEYQGTVNRLDQELQELTLIYDTLKGNKLSKFIRAGFLIFLQLFFGLLTLLGIVSIVALQIVEPAILTEMVPEVRSSEPEVMAGVSAVILMVDVILVFFTLLLGFITFLLTKIRRKNREIRDSISIVEILMHNTRVNLEEAENKLKQFRQFAAVQHGHQQTNP